MSGKICVDLDFFVSSIATMILLSMGIIPLMISTATSVNPFTSNNSFCKSRVYINQFSAMSCRWLLVMACIDRCCSSSANANLRRLSTVYVARRVSFGICLSWLIFPFHTLIFVNLLERKTIVCVVTDSQVRIYHGLYTIILGGILPPSIMFVCSVFIWKNLRERAIRRNFLCPRRHAEYRDDQVMLMLLTQVLIFIISTIPFLSNNLYEALTRDVINKSAERLTIERFLAVLTELFVYVFPASLFYSSTLTSAHFRAEFRLVINKIFPCRHRNQRRTIPSVLPDSNRQPIELPRTCRWSVPPQCMAT